MPCKQSPPTLDSCDLEGLGLEDASGFHTYWPVCNVYQGIYCQGMCYRGPKNINVLLMQANDAILNAGQCSSVNERPLYFFLRQQSLRHLLLNGRQLVEKTPL